MPVLLRLLLLAALLGHAGGAAAQSIVSTGQSFARMSLIGGTMQADGSRLAGIAIRLSPGWKTYWRSPGEAGVPPAIELAGARNLAAHHVLWPRPMLFESFGLSTVGYESEVVLPLRLVPQDPARPIHVAIDLRVGVCSDICVFETARLTADLDPGEVEHPARVAAALAQLPRSGAEAGIAPRDCAIRGSGAKRRFSVTLIADRPLDTATVLLEGPAESWFQNVETAPAAGGLSVRADLLTVGSGAWIGRDDIRITVLGADGFAADLQGCG